MSLSRRPVDCLLVRIAVCVVAWSVRRRLRILEAVLWKMLKLLGYRRRDAMPAFAESHFATPYPSCCQETKRVNAVH
jgi:hypothetical protein